MARPLGVAPPSLRSQRRRRIEAGRAARGEIACDHRHHANDERDKGELNDAVRNGAEEHGFEQLAESVGSSGADDGSGAPNGGTEAEDSDGSDEPEPTATPDGDGGCQFCPEDVDDLAPQPTPTPDGGCNFCPEDLDELAPIPTPTEEPECNFCPDDPIILPNW